MISWWPILLDLLYPRVCSGCGGELGPEAYYLCWNCMAQLPYVRLPYCALCGDPVEGRVDAAFVCYNCEQSRPSFDLARSAVRYTGCIKDLLRHFKYYSALWLQEDLVRLLSACLRIDFDVAALDAVAPVPLYARRRRERGYNQAAALAARLAREIGKPYEGRALRRIRGTATQTHLTAKERAANVRGAFEVPASRVARIRGRRLLLVDDVMTTGATVSECARALKEAGAAYVAVVTVARG